MSGTRKRCRKMQVGQSHFSGTVVPVTSLFLVFGKSITRISEVIPPTMWSLISTILSPKKHYPTKNFVTAQKMSNTERDIIDCHQTVIIQFSNCTGNTQRIHVVRCQWEGCCTVNSFSLSYVRFKYK
jgi:hypothetical protein